MLSLCQWWRLRTSLGRFLHWRCRPKCLRGRVADCPSACSSKRKWSLSATAAIPKQVPSAYIAVYVLEPAQSDVYVLERCVCPRAKCMS